MMLILMKLVAIAVLGGMVWAIVKLSLWNARRQERRKAQGAQVSKDDPAP